MGRNFFPAILDFEKMAKLTKDFAGFASVTSKFLCTEKSRDLTSKDVDPAPLPVGSFAAE
jgi:hypothetical protein